MDKSQKPDHYLDPYGDGVVVTDKVIGEDAVLNGMLQDIGKTIKPADMTHVGSFATHIYVKLDSITKKTKAIAYSHQLVGIATSSKNIRTAIVAQTGYIMKKFGIKLPNTRDPRDKRSRI